MELIYKIKKPESIVNFLHENNVPLKIIEMEDGKHKVFVNHNLKLLKDTVKKGDHLHIFILNEDRDSLVVPEKMDLDIVYEDEYILVVNKPANMQIMVTKAHPQGTLANGLQQYYVDNNILSQIHFVNRLDKESSGLMIIAKNRFIKFLLSSKTEGEIQREYYCIIDGILDLKRSCIDLPIGRQENTIKREVQMSGEECSTSYQVVKEFGHYSLVKIISETGKAHQIRVHFSHFSYPVVGDDLYNSNRYKVDQMLLFSYKVSFQHPINDTLVDLTLDIPEPFQKFMKENGAK
jgi:23S rRNA pseudouridine1911/1915/1917 synthase